VMRQMNSSSKIVKAENIKLVKKFEKEGERCFKKDQFCRNEKAASPIPVVHPPKHAVSGEDPEARRKARDEEYYEKGFAAGVEKNRELQRAEFNCAVGALDELMKGFDRVKKDVLEKAEGQILDLAFSITEKIIHQEVLTNRNVIQGVLREAISNILDRDGIKVRLNPQDYTYMMEMKHNFLQGLDGVKNMVFEEDPSIKRGGALLETSFGEVDARLNQQFSEIKTALLNT
jgi:flagellar assembly protein FliH